MEKWFYTGQKMPDGTPISIAARDGVEEKAFVEKGYEPVSTGNRGAKTRIKSRVKPAGVTGEGP